MNIIISPHDSSSFIYRPDSTLIRRMSAQSYFIPDYVEDISISPIIFLKTSKPGKAIQPRFINRYIDSYSYGLIIHPHLKTEIRDNREFISNSLDYTTLIPLETTPIKDYSHQEVSVAANGYDLFTNVEQLSLGSLYERLSNITTYYSLRIGDFIGFELQPPQKINRDDFITEKVGKDTIFGFSIK